MNKKLTIFTPTFNRHLLLQNLYESLKKQTCNDFVWLIVDDGSTDGTKEKVEQWINENFLEIQYHYQKNSGKMRAHNYAVMNAQTVFFLDIDSDDLARDNCVEKVLDYLNAIENEINVAGVVTYYLNEKEENPSIKNFPTEGCFSLKEIYKNGYKGECTLAFKTDVLKKFLFPAIAGEKFMPESYVYDQIDCQYKYRAFSDYIVHGSYLQDGYSRQFLKLLKSNPKSYAMLYLKKYELERKKKLYLYFLVYSFLGHDIKMLMKNFSCKLMLFSPLALLLALKRLIQYKKAGL